MRAVVLALLLVCAPPSTAQELLYTLTGDRLGDGFGAAALALGDVDGDSIRDLAVAASVRGLVRVFSGADGTPLYTLRGAPGFGVGLALQRAGDAENAELLVLALDPLGGFSSTTFRPGDGLPTGAAVGRQITAAEGAVLPVPPLSSWPRALLIPGALLADQAPADAHDGLLLGDIDGDGRPDRGDSSPFALPARDSGLAWIRLSSTGELLELLSGWSDDAFGWSLANAGDVNGDGHDDVVVGAPGDDSVFADAGAAYVFSGADGAVLFVLRGQAPGERLGSLVGSLGDVDGDGLSDVFVSALQGVARGAGRGVVRVYGGAAALRRVQPASAAARVRPATN